MSVVEALRFEEEIEIFSPKLPIADESACAGEIAHHVAASAAIRRRILM
jgi:hypothetical protein